MADLPSLPKCGALGVGLFRTELQFLIRTTVPKRAELAALYSRILDAAREKPVVFRTLDIGSDKVLPYMKRADEPNPALGWRAIRVGLDRPGHHADAGPGADPRRQRPAAADHVPLRRRGGRVRGGARARARRGRPREGGSATPCPPSSGSARCSRPRASPTRPTASSSSPTSSRSAATTSSSSSSPPTARTSWCAAATTCSRRASSTFLEHIVARCAAHGTPLSFCGEDAGRPIEALALAAIGFRSLSMRPASIGPVKALLRQVDLAGARAVIDAARRAGAAQRPPGARGLAAEGRASTPDRARASEEPR